MALLVGAPLDDAGGLDAGAAYLFHRTGTTWTELAKFTPDDIGSGIQFGWSVSLSDETALCGARLDNDVGANSGSAYVFVADVPETYCTAKSNALGCVPFVTTTGLPGTTDTNPFSIAGNNALPNEAGILLYGFGRLNLNYHGGKLCIKAPVKRLTPKFAKASGPPPCGGVVSRDFNNTIQSGNDPMLTAGETVYAQWRLRDPSDPTGFGDSLTDAIEFTIQP